MSITREFQSSRGRSAYTAHAAKHPDLRAVRTCLGGPRAVRRAPGACPSRALERTIARCGVPVAVRLLCRRDRAHLATDLSNGVPWPRQVRLAEQLRRSEERRVGRARV